LRFAEEVADRVVLLSGGTIVEEGPAREVLTRPKTVVAQRFLSAMAEE
jgi:polar amino acid transport system permease protein